MRRNVNASRAGAKRSHSLNPHNFRYGTTSMQMNVSSPRPISLSRVSLSSYEPAAKGPTNECSDWWCLLPPIELIISRCRE